MLVVLGALNQVRGLEGCWGQRCANNARFLDPLK